MIDFFLEKAALGQMETDIHFFAYEDLYILFDVNSGSVHILDEIMWSTLDALKNSGANEKLFRKQLEKYSNVVVDEALQELYSLVEEGTLLGQVPYPRKVL